MDKKEERYYLGNYEVYRKFVGITLETERTTVAVADDKRKIATIDKLTVEERSLINLPVAVIRYQYDNHLGSASLELDATAQIISYEEYHPFGTTSYRSGKSETEVSLKRYKYVGKERDEETGLYYYGARYYAAWIGRFVSVDLEAAKIPAWSPYCINYNNPVLYIDPNGKIPIIPWLLKAGAGAAADMLAQASMDYLFNPKTTSWGQAFDNVNWWQVGRSGAEGLIPWKTPGGRLGKAALTASGDVVVNAMNNPSGYTAEQAGMDFSIGFIGDLAGGGLGELIAKYGARNVARGLVGKLGWATKQTHALTGVWYSTTDGNFVGELANKLGNVVQDIDVDFKFSGGAGDVDIMTSKFNVEVKSGGKMKLTQSKKNLEYAKSQGKGYILYMPNATLVQIKEAGKQGITICNTEDALKKALGD